MAFPTTPQNISRQSILPPEMNGVVFITGRRGVGKTSLAVQADLPDNELFLDFENKGKGVDAQLHFGKYLAMTQQSGGNDPQSLYNNFQRELDAIEQDRFTTAILDNVSPLEQALRAEAKGRASHYAERYGLQASNITAGRFGGTSSVANFMISEFVAKMQSKGIRLVVVTAHISARWSTGGQIPNKWNIKGADRWQELSILTMILIQGGQPPAPDAIVQKESLGTISIPTELTDAQLKAMIAGETGHTIARRLPYKIPQVSFQKIRKYLAHPVDLTKLNADEVPTTEEMDPYLETLNKEQLKLAMDMASVKAAEDLEDNSNAVLSGMNFAPVVAPTPPNQILLDAVRAIVGANTAITPPDLIAALTLRGLVVTMPEAITAKMQIENELPFTS